MNVGVAVRYPPSVNLLVRVVVSAETETKALLLACQIAGCHGMPVSAEIVDILEI